MGFEVFVDINATEEAVWSALVDVEHWPEWTSSMTSVTRLDSGDLGVGSRARIKQPKIGTMTWTVTDLAAGHSFVWEARRPGLTLVAGHYLTSTGGGVVQLTLSIEQKGVVGRLVEPFTEKAATRSVQLEAQGHKRRAEASVSGQ